MSERVEVSAPEEAWEDADEDAGGVLDAWIAAPGMRVAAEQEIASMMVAKTTYDVVATVAGTLVEQLVNVGDTVVRGQPLAVIEPDGGAA